MKVLGKLAIRWLPGWGITRPQLQILRSLPQLLQAALGVAKGQSCWWILGEMARGMPTDGGTTIYGDARVEEAADSFTLIRRDLTPSDPAFSFLEPTAVVLVNSQRSFMARYEGYEGAAAWLDHLHQPLPSRRRF